MIPKLKLHPPCITTNPDLIKGPDFGGEKHGEPFPFVFEVKILWTGPENIFPRSQLKVHTLPSQKWSFDQTTLSFPVCVCGVWCWNCGFVLTTRWDSLQAPVSWTTTHTSNIQSDTNPWGEPCGVWEGRWINIENFQYGQWRRSFQEEKALREVWLLNEGKIKIIFEKKKIKKKKSSSCFPPFFESGQESVSVS